MYYFTHTLRRKKFIYIIDILSILLFRDIILTLAMSIVMSPTRIRNETKLPIKPVLEGGMIIFAGILKDGSRFVSFENPHNDFHSSSLGSTPHSNCFAQTTRIDSALLHALYMFHDIDAKQEPVRIPASGTSRLSTVLSQLDTWLDDHHGHLRAVQDFDDEVLVRLEGLANPLLHDSETIAIEAYGKSFFQALDAALEKTKANTTQILFFESPVTASPKIEATVNMANSQTNENYTEVSVSSFDNVHRIIKLEKKVRIS